MNQQLRLVLKHLSADGEGKVLFSTIAKSRMFGLGMVPKESFLAYSTQFMFSIIRLVPGNVVTVAIDMCEKNLLRESGYMELRENMY